MMALWLRSRRAAALVLGLVALGAGGTVLGPRALVVPKVFGTGTSSVLVSSFLPLLWGAVLADAFAGRRLGVEVRPSRRLVLLDGALLLTVVAAAATVYVTTVGAPAGPVLILSGVACAVTLGRGAAAGVFGATALVLVTTVYGAGAPGARYVRVLQPDGDPGWSVACGLLACLVAVGVLVSTRVTTQLRGADRAD